MAMIQSSICLAISLALTISETWLLLSPLDRRYDYNGTSPYEIYPVTRTVKDTQFTNTFPYRSHITEITHFNSIYAGLDTRFGSPVL
ncbi:MAG: hypothetical protein BECKG1743E_GA0114224_112202 [Candidatus Kentron sp. G]|nr:MAG: hypothetical protein BECKG1743E_GA0114224_112202 [Candidatus Kentron sp. G]